MTWKEFYKLALKNYNNGGDGIVECWSESDFDEYVQEFGEMTEEAAKAMFEDADEVFRDMTADAQAYKDEAMEDEAIEEEIDYDWSDGFGRCEDDWMPGDAPWKAPGMSASDFI